MGSLSSHPRSLHPPSTPSNPHQMAGTGRVEGRVPRSKQNYQLRCQRKWRAVETLPAPSPRPQQLSALSKT